MICILKSGGLPLVAAVAFLFIGSGSAHAEYRTRPGYFAILSSPFHYGSYTTVTYLRWNPVTSTLPDARPYFVAGPVPFGVKVGLSDQCVSFARAVTADAAGNQPPFTGGEGEKWRRGRQVVAGGVSPGTLIATFRWNGSRWVYSGANGPGHAAVFRCYAPDGSLLCWSQNWPLGWGVVAHAIAGNGKSPTDVLSRNAYFVVEKQ